MTDRQAFIDTIRDCPDDDTVRLVYADYLDEFGNEEDATLARHIREACEEKGLPEVPPLMGLEEIRYKDQPGYPPFEQGGIGQKFRGVRQWYENQSMMAPIFGTVHDVFVPSHFGIEVTDVKIDNVTHRFVGGNSLVEVDFVTTSSSVVSVGGRPRRERDRIRQIRRSVTETRTALLNAFCDKYKLDPSRQEFDKGFVRTLAISLTDLVDNGDAIFAEQPVERVVVTWWNYGRVQSRWGNYGDANMVIESKFDNRSEWVPVFTGKRRLEVFGHVDFICRSTWPKIKSWEFVHGPSSASGRNARLSVNGYDISDSIAAVGVGLESYRQSVEQATRAVEEVEVPDDPSNAAPRERRSNSRKNSIPRDPNARRGSRFPRPR